MIPCRGRFFSDSVRQHGIIKEKEQADIQLQAYIERWVRNGLRLIKTITEATSHE